MSCIKGGVHDNGGVQVYSVDLQLDQSKPYLQALVDQLRVVQGEINAKLTDIIQASGDSAAVADGDSQDDADDDDDEEEDCEPVIKVPKLDE